MVRPAACTYQSITDQSYQHDEAEQQGHHNGHYFLYEMQWLLKRLLVEVGLVEAEGDADVAGRV